LPLFLPSKRLKETQAKPASRIPPERLQEISWQIFGAATPPPGAS